MAGVLRLQTAHSIQRKPQPVKRRRRSSARPAESWLDAPPRASLPALQRACGNQAVCRLVQAQFDEKKPRRKSPAPMNIPKTTTAEARPRLHLVYSGPTARMVASLEGDRKLAEARKNGMAEVLAWEERGSARMLRTAEHSGAFYKWLSMRIDKFPGHLELGGNQYWAIDPKSGRVWLCTLHVIPAEEQEPQSRERERRVTRQAGLPQAGQPGSAGAGLLAGIAEATADYLSAASLLPRYVEWLSHGGRHHHPQWMIPATWYLKKVDPSQWNLTSYLGILNFAKLAMERSVQYATFSTVCGILGREIGLATGKKMMKLAGHEMELLEGLRKGMQQAGVPPLQIQFVLQQIEIIALIKKSQALQEAFDAKDPAAVAFQIHRLLESMSAILSLEYAGLAELLRGGKDDSGFYAACAQTELQRLYYYTKLLANSGALQAFLVEMNIKDQAVFAALRRILETLTGTRSPALLKK